jgi:hypothetical protein
MSYIKSETFLIEVEDPDTAGTYVKVGKATSKDFTKNLELIETNNDDEANVATYIPGRKTLSGSMTVQSKVGDAGQVILDNATEIDNMGDLIKIRLTNAKKVIIGSFYLQESGTSSSTGGLQTQSYSFTCNGAWTETNPA